MEFVPRLGDTSNIQRFYVGGVGRALIVDNCNVCITLTEPVLSASGVHIPALELIWTIPAWCAARVPLAHVAEEIAHLGLPVDRARELRLMHRH